MDRNDLFRTSLSVFIAAFWVLSGFYLPETLPIKAKEAITCHMDESCLSEFPTNVLDNLVQIFSREVGCAVMTDSSWITRIPCCEVEVLHLVVREVSGLIAKLRLRSSFECLRDCSEHFTAILFYGDGQEIQIEFVRTGAEYHIHEVHGLCELLTHLSLAVKEQSIVSRTMRL